jgi:hypothetical protein
MITKGYDFSLTKYEEEGFCGPVQGLTTKEADLYYNEFFKVLGQSKYEAGPTKEVLSAWHHKYRWAFDLATHPSIVNVMTQILGKDIILWAMHFWYKEPNNSKFIPWHQDTNYWPMEPAINATAWMSLGFSIKENGCLRVISGSHRELVPHVPLGDTTSEFANAISAATIDQTQAVDLEMSPGQMAIFNEAIFHGSEMNNSNIARVAFSVRYTKPEVKFKMAEWGGDPDRIKTFLVKGEDRFHLNDEIIGVPPQVIIN